MSFFVGIGQEHKASGGFLSCRAVPLLSLGLAFNFVVIHILLRSFLFTYIYAQHILDLLSLLLEMGYFANFMINLSIKLIFHFTSNPVEEIIHLK